MSKMNFMNLKIDNITFSEALEEINSLVIKGLPSFVVTPNTDHVVKLEKNIALQKAYDHASLVFTDGQPLIWISKIYKTPIKEKISGSDLFPELCRIAAEKGYSVFFFGCEEGIAAQAAKNLKEKYPNLRIAGTYSPPLGFENDRKETDISIQKIKEAAPDMLFVGLGCPKQEIFMDNYKDIYKVPVSIGLGGSFHFEANTIKRAPKWISRLGFEWLYRCFQNPRLISRYANDLSSIVHLVIKYAPIRKSAFYDA